MTKIMAEARSLRMVNKIKVFIFEADCFIPLFVFSQSDIGNQAALISSWHLPACIKSEASNSRGEKDVQA